MTIKQSLLVILMAIPITLYADPSVYGRPWDHPTYHNSPLGYILLPIVVIILILFIIKWISSNKETIVKILKNVFYIFCVGTLFGGFIVLSLLDRNEISSNESSANYNLPSKIMHSSPAIHSTPSPSPTIEQYKPTLKYRTIEYSEECIICNGRGKIICQKCNGSGYIYKSCTECKGRGSWMGTCTFCFGDGYVENYQLDRKVKCSMCNGTGKHSQYCFYCGGSGTKSEICDISAVSYDEKHYQNCNNCNGSGSITRTRQESYYD